MIKKALALILLVSLVGILVGLVNLEKEKTLIRQGVDGSKRDTDIVIKPSPKTNVPSSVALLEVGFDKENIISSATAQINSDKLHMVLSSGQEVNIPIQYEGGVLADRYARIISDPTNEGNKILHYWLKNARIPGAREGYYKGRVQLQLSDIEYSSIFATYRMYLHPDLNLYRSFPKENKWFVVSEFFSGSLDPPYRFLIGLDIVKEKGSGKPLYFLVSGDKKIGGAPRNEKWESVWGDVNTNFEVPVGEWIDMKIGYKEGSNSSGRFYLAAKRVSDATFTTIFDIHNWTYHPSAPSPIPLAQWQPLKLYTSGEIIDYIRENGGVAQMYWDDLKISEMWPQ